MNIKDSDHEDSCVAKKMPCDENFHSVSEPQYVRIVKIEVETVKKTSSLTAESPEVLHILPLIFRYLPAIDLINAKKVCSLWESVTNNTAVWKHAPLDVYGVNILANTPYLHTISGNIASNEIGNELLDAIINNVLDFKRLDLRIWYDGWNVPTVVFQNFIKMFPNLESIILSNCVPAMVESLELLSNSCANLKALTLYCNDHIKNFSDMCIVVSNGFPSLRKLYITHMFDKMQNCKTGVSILLKNKINKLTDLLLCSSDVDSDVLEMILQSIKLQKLEIGIKEWPKIPLDLTGMTSLKSLRITVSRHSVQSETLKYHWLMYLKFPQNLQHFDIHFYFDLKLPTGVINNIINSLPNLRVLKVEKVFDPDLDEQLENISKLSNLHTVCLRGCPLSVKGVEYILKCPKLCEFVIIDVTFTESTYESLKGCKYLGHLALEECVVNPDKLASAMLSMKYLAKLHIFNCKSYTNRGVLDFLNNYMIEKIRILNPKIKVCRCIFNQCPG